MRHNPGAARPADNPFASRRIDGLRYRFRRGGIGDLKTDLARHGNRGAVVGPHGSGKTTLLDALAGELEGEFARVNLGSDTRRPLSRALSSLPAAICDVHVVLIDGAEQLDRWGWWRLHRRVRHAGILVITSHAPGRLPTIHRCTTDPALLRELVAELSPGMVGDADLEALFQRHGGDIRSCLRELYDRWAGRGR